MREQLKVGAAKIAAAVRWVFHMLGRGVRAYGRLLWKTVKLAVVVGLVLATFFAHTRFFCFPPSLPVRWKANALKEALTFHWLTRQPVNCIRTKGTNRFFGEKPKDDVSVAFDGGPHSGKCGPPFFVGVRHISPFHEYCFMFGYRTYV